MAKLAIEAIKRVLTRHFSGLAVIISMIAWPHASPADEASGRTLPADHAAGRYEYTNGLIDSNDPYLLLHAHNPVDWYPWGSEAFAKAKQENKPIFISIGYSTCYWCHVAETDDLFEYRHRQTDEPMVRQRESRQRAAAGRGSYLYAGATDHDRGRRLAEQSFSHP